MYFVYSIVLTLGFLLLLPVFLLKREKYAAGFRERLGNYPEFKHDGRPVIWLHSVSVGETNAARPLVEQIREKFSSHRLIVSTTTRTGQELAKNIFKDKADTVFYFPFDWKFSVDRALRNFRPSLILLMETEIWPRFIRQSKRSGSKIAIVNGRLSEKSFLRYSRVRQFLARVLVNVDLALMQGTADSDRIKRLGMDARKVVVTGNLKFEQPASDAERDLTEEFRCRFGISVDKPLIIAASTHEPEERYVIDSLEGELGHSCRLMIAPRHPERFNAVEKLLRESPYSYVRRTSLPADTDKSANVILLDTIGELRAAYPLAEIVFVGGSLIPHGGQNILEPAASGKAIVTGPYTHNFEAIIKEFLENKAIRQTPESPQDFQISESLYNEFTDLLQHPDKRRELGENAAAVMGGSNRDAAHKTIEYLQTLFSEVSDS